MHHDFPRRDLHPVRDPLSGSGSHCFFSMVGVKFVAFGEGAESRLHALMRDISGEPDKLRKELEVIQQHKAGQREG